MLDSIKQKLKQINLTEGTEYKKAGVLILLLKENDEYKLLFTKRSAKLKTHSGEVSFPGGKWEDKDKDLYETALRESNEEVNLDIKNVTKLGTLNFLLSRHKIEVNPFVGHLDISQEFIGNYEIEEIFTVPLSFVLTYNVWAGPTIDIWIVLILVGICSQLGQIFLTFGYKLLPAGRAATTSYIQVPFSAIAGMLIFHENVSYNFIIGSMVIFYTIFIIVREKVK